MQRLSPQRYAVCLSLGLSFLSSESGAQSTDASKSLFEQAFAQRRKAAVQQIALPTTLDGREIGIVDAQLRADGVWVSREVVMRLLKDLLRPPIYASLGSAEPVGPWVSASILNSLGIDAEYAAQSITLNLAVPLSLRLTRVLKVDNRNDVEPSNKDQIILAPERWSLIANSRWVMMQTSSETNAQNTARVYLDGAQRMGNWVLEAAGSLALNADSGVKSRDMTRLVRDWPTHAIRMSVGDLNTVPRSGLPAVALGGIQLTRRFNLNPALSAQSQPTGRLELPRGAAIDVNVNGFLTRTLQLGPGVYELKDIPVFSGANEVELRIVEPGGRTSTQRFDYFFDAALLAPGLTEFDMALGKPSQVKEGGLTYRQSETVAALSWRQGLSAGTTVGASTQSRNTANGTVHIVQADGLWATVAGTVLASTIRNRHPQFSGQSSTFQWRWQSATQREAAPNRWSWAAAIQATQNTRTATLLSDTASPASRDIGMRLSALVPGGLSATLSASKRTGDNAASNAQTVGLSLRRAIDRQWSVETTLGHQQNNIGANNYFTVGLRYSAPQRADGIAGRVSTLYQSENRRLQLDAEASGIGQVAGADAPWRLSATSSRSALVNEAGLRGTLETSRAEMSAFTTTTRNQNAQGSVSRLTEAAVATTLVVSPIGWAVTRPVADSAAIIVPRPGYEQLSIYVDPSLDRSAAASDRFGAPVLSDLNAYVLREIQLDVANLPPGRSLGVDRPVLQPSNRSVIIVPLGSNANVQFSGALLTAQGQPASLVSLKLSPIGKGEQVDLFTSRRGQFTSPPLPPGRYWLTVAGDAKPLKQLQIEEGQAGLVDLGTLSMTPE